MKLITWNVIAILTGRAPQGARGLKFKHDTAVSIVLSRAPQGARGLKWLILMLSSLGFPVAPRKGRVG